MDAHRTPKALMQALERAVDARQEVGLLQFKEQFLLFSHRPLTHFSVLAPVAEQERNAWRWMPAITSALSAICGTHLGLTKLVTSISFRPAACRRCTNSILTAEGTGCFSFCRPSRGPTSMS